MIGLNWMIVGYHESMTMISWKGYKYKTINKGWMKIQILSLKVHTFFLTLSWKIYFKFDTNTELGMRMYSDINDREKVIKRYIIGIGRHL